MPSEVRHIVFSPAEVVEAVRDYYYRSGQHLPSGQLLYGKAECEADGNVYFRMCFGLTPKERTELLIKDSDLTAALILFCRNRGIPLATRAAKSLQTFGHEISLVCTINPREILF